MFIQVGYGLEGALPDATCKRIIEEEIKPRFRNNDFDGGLSAGVAAILKATKGEYKAGRPRREEHVGPWPIFVVFGLFIFGPLFPEMEDTAGGRTLAWDYRGQQRLEQRRRRLERG